MISVVIDFFTVIDRRSSFRERGSELRFPLLHRARFVLYSGTVLDVFLRYNSRKEGRSFMVRRVPTSENARTLPFPLENDAIADRLIEVAEFLEAKDPEAAANDDRLNTLPGIGRKRLRSVRESLAGHFQRYPCPADAVPPGLPQPPIEDLLAIDEEYRRKARLGRLIQIAPSRFNPDGKISLPILRTRRAGYRYTAMYSNSPLAHELGTTHDWVVIYRKGDDRQWTVVTDHRQSAKGRRIVRGRENECDAHYTQVEKGQ